MTHTEHCVGPGACSAIFSMCAPENILEQWTRPEGDEDFEDEAAVKKVIYTLSSFKEIQDFARCVTVLFQACDRILARLCVLSHSVCTGFMSLQEGASKGRAPAATARYCAGAEKSQC